MEWISVDDKLPSNEKGNDSIYCLVVCKGYGVVVRPYNQYHVCWDDEDGDDFFTEAKGGRITYWMPLPQPPQ